MRFFDGDSCGAHVVNMLCDVLGCAFTSRVFTPQRPFTPPRKFYSSLVAPRFPPVLFLQYRCQHIDAAHGGRGNALDTEALGK